MKDRTLVKLIHITFIVDVILILLLLLSRCSCCRDTCCGEVSDGYEIVDGVVDGGTAAGVTDDVCGKTPGKVADKAPGRTPGKSPRRGPGEESDVDEAPGGEIGDLDIVMCIDCSGSMEHIIGEVKNNALRLYSDLKDACAENDAFISRVRVKVISFRDFETDGANALHESKFFSIPGEDQAYRNHLLSLAASGGSSAPENSLEALAVAMKSDWVESSAKKRHVIILWTDESTKPLGRGNSNPSYPRGIPTSLPELKNLWENGMPSNNAKRLILFTLDSADWKDIGVSWSNTIHKISMSTGLSEVDYQSIVDEIAKSAI